MSCFEQMCDDAMNQLAFVVESNKKDVAKKIYGYSFNTFIPEEIELFESFAEAVIASAEDAREVIRHANGQRIWLDVESNASYNTVKNKFKRLSWLETAWRNFYMPALISVGVPSLVYDNNEYYLLFAQQMHADKRWVSEKEGWKTNIVSVLKFSLSFRFTKYMDSFSTLSDQPTIDFLQERERRIQLKDLANKLPELDGIFESTKESEYESVLTLTFTKLLPEDKETLIKFVTGLHSPYDQINVVSDSVVEYIQRNVSYFWTKKQITEDHPAYKREMLDSIKSDPTIRLSNKDAALFINRIFKNYTPTLIKNKYEELSNKLPEIKGIFESSEEEREFYIMKVKYEKFASIQKNAVLEFLLNKTSQLFRIYYDVRGIPNNTSDKFIYDFEFSIKTSNVKKQKSFLEEMFLSYIQQELEHLQKHGEAENIKALFPPTFVWLSKKYTDIYNKLPETEGLFESRLRKHKTL